LAGTAIGGNQLKKLLEGVGKSAPNKKELPLTPQLLIPLKTIKQTASFDKTVENLSTTDACCPPTDTCCCNKRSVASSATEKSGNSIFNFYVKPFCF